MSAATSMRRTLATASVLTVALLATVSVAGGARSARDTVAPSSPTDVRLVSATTQSVSVVWSPSTDNVRVVGYDVSGEVPPARVREPAYVGDRLPCGESLALMIVAVDRVGNRSAPAHATVATAPCRDVSPPSVPTGFRQSATSQNAVVLVWDRSSDDTGVVSYGVYRGSATIATTSEPAHTLSNLTCGTTYAVAVDAVDAAGNRSARGTTWVQTSACSGPPTPPRDTTPPSQPGAPNVSSTTQTSVRIGWSASSDDVGVSGYDVLADGSRVGQTSSTEYEITGLRCDTAYRLAVVAYDAASNRSSEASVGTSTRACAPENAWTVCSDEYHRCSFVGTKEVRYGKDATWTAPRQFTDGVQCSNEVFGDPVPGAVKVCQVRDLPSTEPPPSPPPTNWVVCANENQRCAFSGSREVRYGKSSTWTSPRSFTDGVACENGVFGDPLPGVTKECQLRQTSDGPGPQPGDTTPPSQPGSLTIASATESSVSLGWAPSTDNVQVTGYGVYRDGSAVSTVPAPGATVSGLACGRAYAFGVDALDGAGNRSARVSMTGTTRACSDNQAPSAPTNVQATSRTGTSIALSWSGSTDNVAVVGYGLYRGGTLVGTASTTTGIFSGLACNTNYTLAVDAYDGAGNRSTRTTVGVATTACADTAAPSAPTGLTVTNVSQTGMTMSWTAASDNVGVAGYDAYVNGGKVGTTSSTSYAVSGLACGTAYALEVVAFDAAGNRSGPASAPRATSACSTPSGSWVKCADENTFCAFTGTKEVRYGKNSTWTTPRQHTGGVSCTNGVFGDPLPGVAKECQVRDLSSGGSPLPPPPPSEVSYPASYYTGPLGNRNPLPTKRGAFLIGWYGYIGCDWSCGRAGVLGREASMGRRYDAIGTSYVPSERREQWIHDHGALPIIAGWNPGGSPQQIISGQRDAQIIELANHVKSYDFVVMIRMFHEFDMEHLSYHACGQTFVDMWRRVVTVFAQQGVRNAGFWWTPNEGYNRSCVASSYPGDQYVDWVGTDTYNWTYVGEDSWSTPLHAGWAEFGELFDYKNNAEGVPATNQHDAFGPRKPFVVGETGTVYDSNHPGRKGDWFRNVVAAAKQMEYLTGIMFFDQDVSAAEGARTNWHVDHSRTNPDVYAGFVQMARDPWFNTRS